MPGWRGPVERVAEESQPPRKGIIMNVLDLQDLETSAVETALPGSTASTDC